MKEGVASFIGRQELILFNGANLAKQTQINLTRRFSPLDVRTFWVGRLLLQHPQLFQKLISRR